MLFIPMMNICKPQMLDVCFVSVFAQPTKSQGQVKDLKIMCAETEEMRKMWICAFRLFKVHFKMKLAF